jgi:hypothetical protein
MLVPVQAEAGAGAESFLLAEPEPKQIDSARH